MLEEERQRRSRYRLLRLDHLDRMPSKYLYQSLHWLRRWKNLRSISYLKMISQGTSGGQLINYSQRFTITGMTGSWQSQSIEDAYTSAKGDVTKVPATANQLASNQNNPAAGGAGGPQFTVPYGMQTTGLTKYAPMQQHPPTAITKQDTSPLFPTTAFNVAQSALPTATQLTTLTASITYSYATRVNTVRFYRLIRISQKLIIFRQLQHPHRQMICKSSSIGGRIECPLRPRHVMGGLVQISALTWYIQAYSLAFQSG